MLKAKKKVINGDVDESLFGTLKKSTKQLQTNKTATISASKLTNITNKIQPHTVLRSADLQTIAKLQATSPLSQSTTVDAQPASDTLNDKLQRAQQHRSVIEAYEAQRVQHRTLTAEELAENQHNALLLQLAKTKLDNELDDVKTMQHMMNYAQIVSVRDAQIAEKYRLQQQQAAEDAQLDAQLEQERVKYVAELAEREAQRKQQQVQGKHVIEQQLAEREQQRFMAAEQRRVEAQHSIEYEQKLMALEKAERQVKIDAGRALLREVNTANAQQLEVKKQRQLEEVAENQRIQQYIAAKEQREAELEREQQRIKAEKEYEINRLRQMQERALDRQGAIDELRAKRYQEQKQREVREAAAAEAQRKLEQKRELDLARQQQHIEKQQKLVQQAEQDRVEYERTVQHVHRLDAAEQHKLAQLQQTAREHRLQLQQQIAEHERMKQTARQQYIAEGNALAAQLEQEKQYIELLKQQKIAELEAAGVKGVYLHELKKKKVLDSKIF